MMDNTGKGITPGQRPYRLLTFAKGGDPVKKSPQLQKSSRIPPGLYCEAAMSGVNIIFPKTSGRLRLMQGRRVRSSQNIISGVCS